MPPFEFDWVCLCKFWLYLTHIVYYNFSVVITQFLQYAVYSPRPLKKIGYVGRWYKKKTEPKNSTASPGFESPGSATDTHYHLSYKSFSFLPGCVQGFICLVMQAVCLCLVFFVNWYLFHLRWKSFPRIEDPIILWILN